MSDNTLVINTSPLIALIAATGDLSLLDTMFKKVIVPLEVVGEIEQGGKYGFGIEVFKTADWLDKRTQSVQTTTLLKQLLDLGESSVIQTAVNQKINTVAIDERVGRRIARLHGLKVIGTLGILLKAFHSGHIDSLGQSIENMKQHGIWISKKLEKTVLDMAKSS